MSSKRLRSELETTQRPGLRSRDPLRVRIVGWLAGFFILGLGVFNLRAPADDRAELPQYFAELRLRGLFSIAEQYGLARLAESPADSPEQGILAVELSRVYSAHAAEAPRPEADELWNRAAAIIQPLAANSSHPRWVAARTQWARLQCDRARAEFWGWRLDPLSSSQKQIAITAHQTALARVIEVQPDLAASSKLTNRGNRTPEAARVARSADGAPGSVELRQLSDELIYYQASLNLQLSQLLEVSPDRAAALRKADETSGELSKHVNSEYLWPARLARLELYRLNHDPAQAATSARSLLNDSLSPDLMESIVAELGRALLEQDLPADAITAIMDQGRLRGELGPECRTVIVECLLRSWNKAREKNDQPLADDLWKQMAGQQALITGSWRRYVDSLLARSSLTRQYGEKLAGYVRQAQSAVDAKNWKQAITAYSQAIDQAETEGQKPLAAELSYTLVSVQIQAGELEPAAGRLRTYSQRYSDDVRAPEAHLLLTWVLGQLSEKQPTAARRLDYVAELKRHLELYAEHPSSQEARWAVAVDAIRHEQWEDAVVELEAIPNESGRGSDVAAQLPYVYEQCLSNQTDDHSRQVWEGKARSQLGRQVAQWPKPPAGWSLANCEAAIRWVRTLMRFRERPYREIDQLLTQVLSSRDVELREASRDGSQLSPDWNRLVLASTQLRIVALAGQGRMGEAETLLSSTMASPQELLSILSGLSQMADRLDEKSRHDLGRIQLAAARRFDTNRNALSPDMAIVIDRCLAEAYTATGDLPEAIEIYERLLKSRSRDRSLLETIARLRVQHGQPDDLQRAKTIYRQLETFDPAGSASWLRSRLNVARVCLKAGEKAECEKLLKVTRILYPEFGEDSLREEYVELESELKK